ncbi:Uncharacterised protein [Mycobacteroides abscessus subsp. massiliense]|nr:Uncharacterised protein [Mycobacteroides abscessus subsp. massiliense]
MLGQRTTFRSQPRRPPMWRMSRSLTIGRMAAISDRSTLTIAERLRCDDPTAMLTVPHPHPAPPLHPQTCRLKLSAGKTALAAWHSVCKDTVRCSRRTLTATASVAAGAAERMRRVLASSTASLRSETLSTSSSLNEAIAATSVRTRASASSCAAIVKVTVDAATASSRKPLPALGKSVPCRRRLITAAVHTETIT